MWDGVVRARHVGKGRKRKVEIGPRRSKPLRREAILAFKTAHPLETLKNVASELGVSYGYARRIWSQYLRREIKLKGMAYKPSFSSTHYWYNDLDPSWYDRAPMQMSDDISEKKTYRTSHYTFEIHPGGMSYFFVYFPEFRDIWVRSLTAWLKTWLSESEVDQFMNTLYTMSRRNKKHWFRPK